MRMILAPVADRPECARALRVAFDLGNKLEASVTGCHIRAHASSQASLSSEFGAFYLGESSKAAEAAWRVRANARTTVAARDLFADIAAKNGYDIIRHARRTPGAIWQEKVGSPDKILRIIGPVSDLVVVSRPAARGGEIARAFMLSALMESGRPVLILPQAGAAKIGRNICIAWNQSVEAARAVSDSIALLQKADNVTIVSCGPEDRVGPKSQQVVNYLRFWGVKAKRVTTRGLDVEKELTDACRDTGSDMLVMGAYSRSRWREAVFGGTSRYMLDKAKIPVLMVHS